VQRKQVSAGVLKDPRFDEACDMMERGNIERAKNLFSQLIRERPDDLNMMQDIAVLYKEKGLTMEFGSIAGVTLKNLLLKSRFEEAAELSLDAVNHHESVNINSQLLIRVGKWLAEQDRFGDAHDVYRAIIAESDNPQVVAKASLSLAKLLSGKMQNPRDAVDVLKDAEKLGLDSEWNERIIELKEMIRSMHPEVVETKKIEDILV
jgi:predicted Zn-dependent protease